MSLAELASMSVKPFPQNTRDVANKSQGSHLVWPTLLGLASLSRRLFLAEATFMDHRLVPYAVLSMLDLSF